MIPQPDSNVTKGRYWRIYITSPSQDGTDETNIVNVNLIGRVLPTGKKVDIVNLCKHKEVTVSSGQNEQFITDGVYDTKWQLNAEDGDQWFYVDLGGLRPLFAPRTAVDR